MNKEMIISSNGHETRVAILEDDQLAELFVEREQNRGVVGNAATMDSRNWERLTQPERPKSGSLRLLL